MVEPISFVKPIYSQQQPKCSQNAAEMQPTFNFEARSRLQLLKTWSQYADKNWSHMAATCSSFEATCRLFADLTDRLKFSMQLKLQTWSQNADMAILDESKAVLQPLQLFDRQFTVLHKAGVAAMKPKCSHVYCIKPFCSQRSRLTDRLRFLHAARVAAMKPKCSHGRHNCFLISRICYGWVNSL